MDTNNFDPSQYGATPFDPKAMGASPATPEDSVTGLPKTLLDISQGAGNLVRSAGLGIVPDTLATSAPMQTIQKITGINPMMGSQDIEKKTTNTPIGRVLNPVTAGEDLAGAGMYMVPEVKLLQGAGVASKLANVLIRGGVRGELYGTSQGEPTNAAYPAAGAALEPILALLKSGKLTQKGVNRLTTEAKNASVARGEYQTIGDFQKAVSDKLDEVDPHGLAADLRQAVQDRMSKLPNLKTTAGSEGGGQYIGDKPLSADWFHGLRQTLDDEINWARKTQSPVAERAARTLRQVASNQLHTMAPETEGLDKLNRLYYNPLIKGGKIPFANLGAKYPTSVTGVPSALINAALATLGITEGPKLLGR